MNFYNISLTSSSLLTCLSPFPSFPRKALGGYFCVFSAFLRGNERPNYGGKLMGKFAFEVSFSGRIRFGHIMKRIDFF